jgi:hypothetical protein
MGNLERRLSHLEDKNPGRTQAAEEAHKRHWLATARARRNHENRNRDEFHAHDIFRVLRLQGRLGATTEEVRSQLLTWQPLPSERAVERVLARAIYEQEDGTEGMVCPPEWQETFVAADKLRERYARVPDETLAWWIATKSEAEIAGEAEAYGITEDLIRRAMGPDIEEITDEEMWRRHREMLSDLYYGEQGYRVQRHLTPLEGSA